MKKKDIVEGIVKSISFPNIGIVDIDGCEVQVKNVIPGQRIKIQIQKARKSKITGRLIEVLESSSLECCKDVCKHFGECGGCLYAAIPYEEELRIKAKQVEKLIAPVIGEEHYNRVCQAIEKSPIDTEYRNKMEFSFGDEYKGGPLSLGMHKRGAFYDIVTVNDCRIIDDDYKKILLATLSFFKEREVSFYNKNTHEGFLRHLLLRKGKFSKEILVCLVTASGMEELMVEEWSKSISALKLDGTISGILHTKNDRVSDVIEDQGTNILFGKEYFYEKLLGLKFKITPFSFFQTNSMGAEVLYKIIRQLTPKSGTVYDLYCGTGTIGQIVSENAKKVIGIEIVKEAVIAANENADSNGIKNTKFIAGDVLKALDEVEEKPDMIILDPPREGVNPKALKKILSYDVNQMIYVSCKPTSLARDLEMMKEYGYEVDYIKPVDMFPRTGNVETVCLLSNTQKKKESYVTLDVEMDDYYRIKDEGKSTK